MYNYLERNKSLKHKKNCNIFLLVLNVAVVSFGKIMTSIGLISLWNLSNNHKKVYCLIFYGDLQLFAPFYVYVYLAFLSFSLVIFCSFVTTYFYCIFSVFTKTQPKRIQVLFSYFLNHLICISDVYFSLFSLRKKALKIKRLVLIGMSSVYGS